MKGRSFDAPLGVPRRSTPTECRGCRALIVWIKSATSGKPIPVNAEAASWVDPKGSGEVRKTIVTDDGHVVSGTPVPEGYQTTGCKRGRTSHFATCTQAGAFRRTRT